MKYLLVITIIISVIACTKQSTEKEETDKAIFYKYCGYEQPTKQGQILYLRNGSAVILKEQVIYHGDNPIIELNVLNMSGESNYIDCRKLSTTKPVRGINEHWTI